MNQRKIKTSPSKSFETGEVGEVRASVVRVASFEKKNPTIPPIIDSHFHTANNSLAHLRCRGPEQN